ncbi:hypothetical protein ASPCADRAFT_210146 [Aspergillus carbonarius ITEM 5010]|uniref:Xylanolytic transcriptional activator regulatory domain-containing protein n=1 Tax=Aspergillus carbonarius (strain ITEM 5010) TaxID=602072 RepID=A0A1R3REK5_ASPC5|nr:hypothetical protein ASPCADRAFT_210146 [Aspergillus carbonarius ITEM 5010]
MLTLLGTTAESAGRRKKLMSLWTDDGASETLHESWKTSRLYGALEKMLSNSDLPTDSTAPPPESRLPSHTASATNALQLPPQTSQLLDVYFAVTHSWFPIVAKHNILRASYLYASAPLSVTRMAPGSGDHAALWALLSYTISQSRVNPQDGALEVLSKTREYYSVARTLIPSETERYELGHVQALLLLTLVNIGLEDWTAAWLLSGQAVRMAISMDLGAFTDVRRSDELRQGKAVFLGCFVVDSLLSFRLSRRPCMHPRDLTLVGLLEEDGLEEWNSWADVLPPTGAGQGKSPPRRGPLLALSCFNRLVELAGVLNKIARDSTAGPNAPLFAEQLVLELKQWDDRLPLGCRLIGPESIYPERHSALLPHQSYLGLTYVATLLWLYLRIAPQELGLHRSQRPAIEGAKKLLYRALPMVSQHLDNFQVCGLPPLFELSLRTIAEQAFTLRNKIESDIFPFGRWTEALLQRTTELSSTWPVYRSLAALIDQWYRSKDLPGNSPLPYQAPGAGPAPRVTRGLTSNALPPITMATSASGYPNMPSEPSMDAHMRRNAPGMGDSDYTSTIMGITIPVDGQYMTPKDTAMENADLSMMDVLPRGPRPHPSTPDSAVSSTMMSGTAPTGMHDRSIPSGGSDTTERHIGPTGDIDAIFKDLAYLDTTEWSNSREAALKDFGFIDDSTFQAFCHDPDRLAGSQPLVHPPSIADIWPPPGFFPETFRESREDVMEG